MTELTQTKTGISGSMIGEIAGLVPFSGSGPAHAWARIFGLDKELDSKALRRGTHIGPALCSWYAEETGQTVTHIGRHEKQFVYPKNQLVRATPDGLIRRTKDSKPHKVLEVKSPGIQTREEWGTPGTDEIPEYYVPQTIWEMAATETNECDVVPMIVQQDGGFPIYTIYFDDQLFGILLDLAEKFWRDYVVTQTPPPPDGGKASRELLDRLYPHTKISEIIEVTEEQGVIMCRYADARRAIRQAEEIKSLAEQQLLAAIGEHNGISSQYGKLSMIERKGSPAWKKIADELGATRGLIEQFTGSTVRYPRWVEKKESEQ